MFGVKKKDRITDTILDLVALKDKSNSYTRNLSGGLKRRLLIAKALVRLPITCIIFVKCLNRVFVPHFFTPLFVFPFGFYVIMAFFVLDFLNEKESPVNNRPPQQVQPA